MVSASLDFLGSKSAHIANGRCVDQEKQSLRRNGVVVGLAPISPSILGADIDRWVRRNTLRAKDLIEFSAVVCREEDVVTRQRKAIGFRQH